MILIIGGASSGKKTFAKQLGYSQEDFDDARIGEKPVLYNLQKLVRERELDDTFLKELLEYEVIICTELGSGIVPISAKDRAWRDATGRICTQLAQRADTVIRMVCGIPTTLKGDISCNS